MPVVSQSVFLFHVQFAAIWLRAQLVQVQHHWSNLPCYRSPTVTAPLEFINCFNECFENRIESAESINRLAITKWLNDYVKIWNNRRRVAAIGYWKASSSVHYLYSACGREAGLSSERTATFVSPPFYVTAWESAYVSAHSVSQPIGARLPRPTSLHTPPLIFPLTSRTLTPRYTLRFYHLKLYLHQSYTQHCNSCTLLQIASETSQALVSYWRHPGLTLSTHPTQNAWKLLSLFPVPLSTVERS